MDLQEDTTGQLNQLDARYFVLLNSDIEVTEGWLAATGQFHG